MNRPIRVAIAEKRNFQPVLPLMRSRVFAKRMAYWHARIMRMSGREHRWVCPPPRTSFALRIRRAHGYMREWARRNPHAPIGARPRAYMRVDINTSPIS